MTKGEGPLTCSVHLVATVHDPQDRLAAPTRQYLPALLDLYCGVILLCSQATSPQAVTLLRDLGATVACDDDEPDGHFYIGHKRRQALRLGLAAGAEYLHLCDFDRALHWTAIYPDELGQTVVAIPGYDLLILGRTRRAFETHPSYQTRTEALANHVFGLAYGQEMDVTSGSRALSYRAAEHLVTHSQERGVGVDAEWPLLLRSLGGMKIGYRTCEGLEFETPDRYGTEIEAAGGLLAWTVAMNAAPQRWAHRLRLATEIAEAAARLAGEKK
jgi:hypothetical protein